MALTEKKHAFTLVELMVSMIIIFSMASLAIPRLTMHAERSKSTEAIHILQSIYNAQQSYFYENQAYASALSALDITVPPSSNFSAPTAAATDPIVSIQRNNGSYTLRISSAGTVSCAGSLCAQLGY